MRATPTERKIAEINNNSGKNDTQYFTFSSIYNLHGR